MTKIASALTLLLLLLISCNSKEEIFQFNEPEFKLPILSTYEIESFDTSTAILWSKITDTGGLKVSEKGICYSTKPNPTISDNKIAPNTWYSNGDFKTIISGLLPNTNYYVKSYAVNELGIGYGNQVSFTTESEAEIEGFRSWALKPPMGWNSWDCYGPTVTESEVIANAVYMNQHLKAYGWEYVVVDIRWYVENTKSGGYNQYDPIYVLDQYGRYIPATNKFPSATNGQGFKSLADQVHAMGLKFGIHMMRGIPKDAVNRKLPIKGTNGITADQIYSTANLCTWLGDNYSVDASKPGAQEYYDSLFEMYAEWGVDFIKIDDLSAPTYHKDEVNLIRNAIDRCGRPIVFSTSPGETPVDYALHVSNNANMWRMVNDVWDSWWHLNHLFDVSSKWYNYISPGTWPDCDMIPLGRLAIRGEVGSDRYTNLTIDEQYSLMTFFSIFKSPLMFGGDLPSNDDFTLSLLTNNEVLKMHSESSDVQLLFKTTNQMAIKSVNQYTDEVYLAMFNLSNVSQNIKVSYSNLNIVNPSSIIDLWQNVNLDIEASEIVQTIPSHGTKLLKIK